MTTERIDEKHAAQHKNGIVIEKRDLRCSNSCWSSSVNFTSELSLTLCSALVDGYVQAGTCLDARVRRCTSPGRNARGIRNMQHTVPGLPLQVDMRWLARCKQSRQCCDTVIFARGDIGHAHWPRNAAPLLAADIDQAPGCERSVSARHDRHAKFTEKCTCILYSTS
eukprot:4407720-Prymnesium_polylepis.3